MGKVFDIKKLEKEIKKHNKAYWEDSDPKITDIEYDFILRELEDLDPDNALLKPQVPKVHSMGSIDEDMLSLNKTYHADNAPKGKKSLMAWVEQIARTKDEIFLIQPKYDGVSAFLNNKMLTTKGQGTESQNISDKLKILKFLSSSCDHKIRGEIIITNADYNKYFSQLKRSNGEKYKNQRSAVAGILGMKDISDINIKPLTLIDFNHFHFRVSKKNFKKEWDIHVNLIKSAGYPIDGVVVKVEDDTYYKELGSTGSFPKGAIAFKFTGVSKVSTIEDINWTAGTSCLTPVAKITPIIISGVTITNVTLHNLKHVKDNMIHVLDRLEVERAGDVIPHMLKVIHTGKGYMNIPTACPYCKGDVMEVGTELICLNDECEEMVLNRALKSIKRLDIEELGVPTLRKILKKFKKIAIDDLLNLTIKDISELEGYGEKSATKLFNNIQSVRVIEDYKYLASLGFHGIGLRCSKVLLSFMSFNELLTKTKDDLMQIKDLGEEMSFTISDGLSENKDLIDRQLSQITLKGIKGTVTKTTGPKVVFTGKMELPRKELEEIALNKGFTPVSGLSKDVDLLVVADENSTSSKTKKAIKYGIEIISIKKWLKE